MRQLYKTILALFPHLNRKPHNLLETGESKDPIIPPDNTKTESFLDPSFPEGELISLAKGRTVGPPPMTLKSSLNLSWDSQLFQSSLQMQVDHPSLGLKNGSLLVVRGRADWQEACRQEMERTSVTATNDLTETAKVESQVVTPLLFLYSTSLLVFKSFTMNVVISHSHHNNPLL